MLRHSVGIVLALFLWAGSEAHAQQIKLLVHKHDPYGAPRPGRGDKHVPLRTSFYWELVVDGSATDAVLPESVGLRLVPAGGDAFDVLKPGRQFAPGYSGSLFTRKTRKGDRALAVYVDSETSLQPDTVYTARVNARSHKGAELPTKAGTWRFTTEATPAVHPVHFELQLETPPVQWAGGFFTGFCKPSFCTSHANRIPSYELIDEVRKEHPSALSLQRDFWLTGMEYQPKFLSGNLPNIVRERETRRIAAIEKREEGLLLSLEDFFGHGQYGIPAGRPVSADYHPGDEVLIADGVHDARAKVLTADDAARTVLVTRFDTPPDGWKLAYSAKLPVSEDPNAPGLFPPGGCYLRKFRPSGTPCYYWGRLHKEWDLAHRRFGRRLMPNFTDAPGDLSMDGRNWTTAKDYAEYHQVVRDITGHVIERYGDASLDFVWSVFNEPDLGRLFWRSDWNEMQKFYDYTIDGILRAFEDHGYDSDQVFVGGLELAAIFGTNLRIRDFLIHCSPTATGAKALALNAAFADRRLEGKRSKRVERLCRASMGRGAPCDFVSIHSYNRSDLTAAKLARAKEVALEVDPDYYAKLWVNSHESCPDWAPPPDPAAADSYLGNGYFPTWCADVIRRQLQQAAADRRYAFGETILTFWPWPNRNFGGANACTRTIHIDNDGDGREDETVSIPMPILHFLGLVSGMHGDYWVLPERTVGGHVVSGFVSRTEQDYSVLLYSHHALDTQSRSDRVFEVDVRLRGLPWEHVWIDEYRFDKNHNSYFSLGKQLRDGTTADASQESTSDGIETALNDLETGDKTKQLAALAALASLGRAAQPVAGRLLQIIEKTEDEDVRKQALKAAVAMSSPSCYPAETLRQIQDLATLRTTASSTQGVNADGSLRITARVAGNGTSVLRMRPVDSEK